MVLTAFRQNIEILAKPAVWIPQQITFHNFQGIFGLLETQQGLPVASYFVNSLVISVTSTIVAIAVGMPPTRPGFSIEMKPESIEANTFRP